MDRFFAAAWPLLTRQRPAHCPTASAPSSDALAGLDGWPAQVPAVIHSYVGDADEMGQRTRRRMAELGFLPGEVVRIVARGWLKGSPVAVRVGQSTFALRQHEAAMLRVHAEGATE